MFDLRTAKALLALLFFTLAGAGTWAEEASPPSTFEQAAAWRSQGKILAAVRSIEKNLEHASASQRSGDMQLLAQYYTMAGNVEKAIGAYFEALHWPPPETVASETVALPPGLTRHDAIAAIVSQARDRQIVILNEAHHVARDRAFGLALALALREIGFEYLAAETFSKGDDFAIPTGYPTRETGLFTNGPLFADLIRQALRAGYKAVNYDIEPWQRQEGAEICVGHQAENLATSSQGRFWSHVIPRERAQACNLIDRILAKDQDARIFIYVGYDHGREDIFEMPDGQKAGWMAALLKLFTGIDPLTIDQIMATDWGTQVNGNPDFRSFYTSLDKAGLIDGPSLIKTAAGDWLSSPKYQGKIDLTVFHPPQHFKEGRPDWLFAMPGRKRVEIERDLLPGDQRVLVQAFVAGETERPIALDQAIAEPHGVGPIPLALYAGDYRLQYQNERGDIVDIGALTVPD